MSARENWCLQEQCGIGHDFSTCCVHQKRKRQETRSAFQLGWKYCRVYVCDEIDTCVLHKPGAWAQSVPAVADLGLTKHWCCFTDCILVSRCIWGPVFSTCARLTIWVVSEEVRQWWIWEVKVIQTVCSVFLKETAGPAQKCKTCASSFLLCSQFLYLLWIIAKCYKSKFE